MKSWFRGRSDDREFVEEEIKEGKLIMGTFTKSIALAPEVEEDIKRF